MCTVGLITKESMSTHVGFHFSEPINIPQTKSATRIEDTLMNFKTFIEERTCSSGLHTIFTVRCLCNNMEGFE